MFLLLSFFYEIYHQYTEKIVFVDIVTTFVFKRNIQQPYFDIYLLSTIFTMQINSDDDFIELDQEQIENSVYVPKKNEPVKAPKVIQAKFTIIINQSQYKNTEEMNIFENKYYLIHLQKQGKTFRQNLLRRFSDFHFLFETLFKKYPGAIFPAFPIKDLKAYMKAKVSIAKDDQFLKNRMKIVERFMNKILNYPQFNCQTCEETKKFFQDDKEFKYYKETQKGKTKWGESITTPLSKIWNYFQFSANNDTKYKDIELEINLIKKNYENFFIVSREIQELTMNEIQANKKLIQKEFTSENFINIQGFIEILRKQQDKLINFHKKAKQLIFEFSCQNEDFIMVFNSLQYRLDLKKNQQQYYKVQKFDEMFPKFSFVFVEQKKNKMPYFKQQIKDLLAQLQQTSKID